MLFTESVRHFRKYMVSNERSKETIKGYSIELRLLNNFLSDKYNGPVYLEEITLQDLEDYLQKLKEKGNAPASRNRSLYIIRAFFNFCYKKGYSSENMGLKLEAVPEPAKERIFLTPDEMNELILSVRPSIVKTILYTLYYTGMRISECINLTMGDVNFKEKMITVRKSKNNKDRNIPIHDKLLPILHDYSMNERKQTICSYFFVSRNNNRVSPDYINRVLRETTQSLGWSKKVTCHIIRHSFASNLVAKNVNIVNIQKLLGHSNLSTTSVYTHTNMSELIKAVNTI
jgi:site-specific recombinase XerD